MGTILHICRTMIKWIGRFPMHSVLMVLFLVACRPVGDYASNDADYVDLNVWFDEQIKALDQSDLKKSSTWNGVVAPDSIYHPVWSTELEPFLGIPLNPASWRSDYHVDDQLQDGKQSHTYSANSSTNRLRRLTLVYQEGELSEVRLLYATSNLLKNAKKSLIFRKGKGYEVMGRQKTRFFPEEKYEIRGTFVAPHGETVR